MEQIIWPESIGFPSEWNTQADEIYTHLNNENHMKINIDVVGYGGGRRVYDISHITNIPSVLKVSRNEYGIKEITKEINQRKKVQEPYKSRLVPIYEFGYGWCVQPKCKEEKGKTVDDIKKIFDSTPMNDSYEIYLYNVGIWNNYSVIFDCGGIGF